MPSGKDLPWKTLILQGIAASIDALAICLDGIRIGRRVGALLSSRASMLGLCTKRY